MTIKNFKPFFVFPEVADKVPVVILIHENIGLNDWARSMADQIAAMGYIVLAPDLLSGKAPDGGGTSTFKNSNATRTALYALNPDQITKSLKASLAHGKQIDTANGKVAVVGFCWGGSQSFRFVSNEDQLAAAFVCYGTVPKNKEAYKTIDTPVYGFYGGNDNQVNATMEKVSKP
ncbi:dienelactone hydrolase family protein [Flavobacteriaceae bacterium]|nr:dienelactone hydrolase family protein [Flavobacteriaceae bacterium]